MKRSRGSAGKPAPGKASTRAIPAAAADARSEPAARAQVERDMQQAVQLHQAKQLDEAEQIYRRVLQRMPGHAHALQLLGTIEGQRGNVDAALALLRQAIVFNPENGHAHANLGKALSQAEQLEEALSCFQRALELMPDNVKAMVNLGRTYFRLRMSEAALELFDRALQIDPQSHDARIQRSEVLIRMAQTRPEYREAAIASLHAVQEQEHDVEAVRYALAALGAEPPPPVMPAGAVARLFDDYADRFDQHLTGALAYRTPELIGQMLSRLALPPPGRVLDLGCGTGLCGPYLRPLATELTGVDLSLAMLEKARLRQEYDQLVCAELVEFLRALQPGVMLAVAADVFVYIGDLSEVFKATAEVLQPGGVFAFSVERTEGPGFVLNPTRRYAHADAYVASLAMEQGFAVVGCEAVVLRKESGVDVDGTVFALRRQPAPA